MASDPKKRRADGSGSKAHGTAKGCITCADFKSQPRCLVLDQEKDLITSVAMERKKKKKKVVEAKLEPFFQRVNAAMNKKDGEYLVCLHTENPHLLGEFDKKVDNKLASLIPDDSFFEENFDRYFHDQKHVVYKVKQRDRPFSTLDFATRVSLNKGLNDPTHTQMRRFVQMTQLEHEPETSRPRQGLKFVFAKNAEVKVKTGNGDGDNLILPFQEGVRIQAKPAKDKLRSPGHEDRINAHLQLWWNDHNLAEYISAFAKLPTGGSIFLGVREELDRGQQTGKFICQGIVCDENERAELEGKLREMINQKMKWVSRKPFTGDDLISIYFHDVGNGQIFECVIEIIVNYFHGVCFHDADGPKSYTLSDNRKEQKLVCEEWRDEMLN